jgi:methionyl-tRNA synthetase
MKKESSVQPKKKPALRVGAVMCSCGVTYIPQSYYMNNKCFLCEETPQKKAQTEIFNKMSDLQKTEYLAQLKEDEANYNLVRLSH